MTTEVLRNMLYAGSPTLPGLGYVVLDEVHYLADRSRGAVWEEVIIHLPESVRVVALSATVSNAEEFGDWLDQVRGGTRSSWTSTGRCRCGSTCWPGTGSTTCSPTTTTQPRSTRLAVLGEWLPRVNPELQRGATWIERKAPGRPAAAGRRPAGSRGVPARRHRRLDASGLLPAITFIFSRAGCDAAVQQCLAPACG
jgi:ATP-dependent RNA helicase HelY